MFHYSLLRHLISWSTEPHQPSKGTGHPHLITRRFVEYYLVFTTLKNHTFQLTDTDRRE